MAGGAKGGNLSSRGISMAGGMQGGNPGLEEISMADGSQWGNTATGGMQWWEARLSMASREETRAPRGISMVDSARGGSMAARGVQVGGNMTTGSTQRGNPGFGDESR